MKFGYRDRIILIIVLVVVILGIGIFVFIKPKWEDLDANKKKLETLQTDWQQELNNFATIPTKQESINRKYDQSLEIAENFTDEMNSIELDQFLQEKFLNIEEFIEHDVSLNGSLSVSDQSASTIQFYYYTPSVVTYPLYEYADMDGSLAAAAAEKRHEADVLSARTAQSAGAGNSSFTLIINREDTMALIDAVHEYAVENKDAMLLNSVTITDYHFNKTAGVDYPEPEYGDDFTATTDTPGYTLVSFSYTVYYMQEPMKPDVGPSYDASIWDGNGWKNYTAE